MNNALAKSRSLLLENLTPEQRREFEAREAFTVEVKDERYEIRPDITERHRDHSKFCAIIPNLPVYDQMLARKLYLESDPEAFFKAANLFLPEGRLRLGCYRIDQGLAEQHFRVALMRAFSERGMDARLLEIRIVQDFYQHAYEITVRYAAQWGFNCLLDKEHWYTDNLAAVLDSTVSYLADGIWQASERHINSTR